MIEQIKLWAASQAVELFASISGALMHVMFAWAHPVIAARQFIICILSGYWFGPVVGGFITHYTIFSDDKAYAAGIAITGLGGVYALEIIVGIWRTVRDHPESLLKLVPWRKQ